MIHGPLQYHLHLTYYFVVIFNCYRTVIFQVYLTSMQPLQTRYFPKQENGVKVSERDTGWNISCLKLRKL